MAGFYNEQGELGLGILEDGVLVAVDPSGINFTGAGVTVSYDPSTGIVTVDIPGGGGGGSVTGSGADKWVTFWNSPTNITGQGTFTFDYNNLYLRVGSFATTTGVFFTGAGLDDMTADVTLYNNGFSPMNYTVTIDSTGFPDTFTWVDDFGNTASNVPITGTAQALSFGVTITFGATSGHTNGNSWTFEVDDTRTTTDGIIDAKYAFYNNGYFFGAQDTTTFYNSLSIGVGSGNPLGGVLNMTNIGVNAGAAVNGAGDSTSIGANAGFKAVTASNFTAVGANALYNHTDGDHVTALGAYAGYTSTTSSNSMYLGDHAGYMNNADFNMFIGHYAGYANTTGGGNTFIGSNAGGGNTTGAGNFYIGTNSGSGNLIGNNNIMIGSGNFSSNGLSGSIAIGSTTAVTASNQFVLGGIIAGTEITDAYLGNGVQNNTPVVILTINGTGIDGFTSDTAGTGFRFASGKGSGNSTPAPITFALPSPLSSGASIQDLLDRFSINDGYISILPYSIDGNIGHNDVPTQMRWYEGFANGSEYVSLEANFKTDDTQQIIWPTTFPGGTGYFLAVQSLSAPQIQLEWVAAAGGGTVTGTGSDKQLAYWTSSTNISGENDAKWDYTTNQLILGAVALNASIYMNGGFFASQDLVINNVEVGAGIGALSGGQQTVFGVNALAAGSSGSSGTFVGYHSGYFQASSGNENSAFGALSLLFISSGAANTAIGYNTLSANSTGSDNVAVGWGAGAGSNTSRHVYLGSGAQGNHSDSISLGFGAQTSAAHQLVVGSYQTTAAAVDSYIDHVFLGSGITGGVLHTSLTIHASGMATTVTDGVGLDLIVAAGRSTGAAAPARFIIQTGIATTTGTTAQTLVNRAVWDFSSVSFQPWGVSSGNTYETRYLELAANGTNYIGWKGADSRTTNLIIQLPNTDPTAGQIMTFGAPSSGVSVATWASGLTNTLTNAHIFVGNVSNIATDVAVSGDLTLANTGAFTIVNDAVTFAKFQNITTNKLLGRATAGTGDMEEITLGTGLSYTGTTLNVSGFSSSTLTDSHIFVGNSSNVATDVAMSGDVTISNTGVTTIKTNVNLAGSPTTTTQAASDNSTKIATTAFVGTAISNALSAVNPAVAVAVATVTVLPNTPTYSNGVGGIGATLTAGSVGSLTIDGYTPLLNERILVKNQASAFQNGVYNITQLGTGLLPYILTRALDYDIPSNINSTGAIPVVNGTVNATTSWLLTSTVNTVGTDALTYVQFSIAPTDVMTLSGIQTVTGAKTFSTGLLKVADIFTTGGASSLAFTVTPSQVDGWTIIGAATANPATVKFNATGSDSNINAQIQPKGTGRVQVTDGTDPTKILEWNISGATTGKKLTIASSFTNDRTVTFPDNTGTVAELNLAQTWTAAQTYTTLLLKVADIADANGNIGAAFTATASAVDYFTFVNAATANPATISMNATGSDSNINVRLSPKGTGRIAVSDGTDLTKLALFNLSGTATGVTTQFAISSSVNRTITFFDASDTIVGLAVTQTLTNKRITARVSTTASSATPTPNADTDDEYTVTALAANATFGAPTGTPTEGQKLIIRVKDNATARTLAYNAIYRAIGITLPTTTVISKTLYLGMIYNNTDTKWDVVSAQMEA